MSKTDLTDNVVKILREAAKTVVELEEADSDVILEFKNTQIKIQINSLSIILVDFMHQISEKVKNEEDNRHLLSYIVALTSMLESLSKFVRELEEAYNSETE